MLCLIFIMGGFFHPERYAAPSPVQVRRLTIIPHLLPTTCVVAMGCTHCTLDAWSCCGRSHRIGAGDCCRPGHGLPEPARHLRPGRLPPQTADACLLG